jgi:hypothetical protein
MEWVIYLPMRVSCEDSGGVGGINPVQVGEGKSKLLSWRRSLNGGLANAVLDANTTVGGREKGVAGKRNKVRRS